MSQPFVRGPPQTLLLASHQTAKILHFWRRYQEINIRERSKLMNEEEELKISGGNSVETHMLLKSSLSYS